MTPEELRDAVLRKLQGKKLIPGMIGIRKGELPNELVFLTSEGDVRCSVEERDCFVCLKLPSGQTLLIPDYQVFGEVRLPPA